MEGSTTPSASDTKLRYAEVGGGRLGKLLRSQQNRSTNSLQLIQCYPRN